MVRRTGNWLAGFNPPRVTVSRKNARAGCDGVVPAGRRLSGRLHGKAALPERSRFVAATGS
jgi:hypothetical protein